MVQGAVLEVNLMDKYAQFSCLFHNLKRGPLKKYDCKVANTFDFKLITDQFLLALCFMAIFFN